MNSFLFYLLQVSLIFGGFYLLYNWLFSRFTFHNFNRGLLLLIVPLSFLLPFSNVLFPQIAHFSYKIPLIENLSEFTKIESFSEKLTVSAEANINYVSLVFSLYVIGVLVFLSRFVRTTYKLFQLKKHSEKFSSNNTTLYKTDVSEIFSYFQWIFIPKSHTSIDELIITHEKAHIKKLHSIDVVFAELFIAICWFHPLAYSYRKSLKAIHEFQADAFVLQQKVKKSAYLELLLRSLEPKNTNPIYNYFSHPTLKKRIEMMTKLPSKKHSKLLYLLLIPAIALAFMAFRTPETTFVPKEMLPIAISTNGTPSLFPVQNGTLKNISSKFGVVRKHPKLKNKTAHNGIDIKAKLGTPVVATADGVIVKAKNEGNWGNLIVISHANGFETWYAHLKGFNTVYRKTVKKGDIIGYVGNTGLSTAPHLHYEVHQHGKRLNPVKYITE
ncbi:M23/M56 family metallopeptidase [Kordia algicida OT-1]|uniref:M23/M37 peptidase domain protein n=1 Tax=Kordia algicida OT-1 TaxID=391587 RepID=A9EBB6_9FLAO|nr:M23/M56 family metallopeptidase [Kordia algicida]EDP94453.1 M23/M37 peptidase domain protein [Kordia algicida OT-1]